MQNLTNLSLNYSVCFIPHRIETSEEFIKCYWYFFRFSFANAILHLVISFGSIIANTAVVYLILKRSIKLSIFDKILIGHALVDGLTGLIDVPLFHISNIFGYWPFGSLTSKLWVSLISINKISFTIFTLLYLNLNFIC
jgi:hypothetical protein